MMPPPHLFPQSLNASQVFRGHSTWDCSSSPCVCGWRPSFFATTIFRPHHRARKPGAIAQHLIAGHGFATPFDTSADASPSTHLPPLYPYFLAGLQGLHLASRAIFYIAIAINLLASSLLSGDRTIQYAALPLVSPNPSA